jgi:hypothetical protein
MRALLGGYIGVSAQAQNPITLGAPGEAAAADTSTGERERLSGVEEASPVAAAPVGRSRLQKQCYNITLSAARADFAGKFSRRR